MTCCDCSKLLVTGSSCISGSNHTREQSVDYIAATEMAAAAADAAGASALQH